MTDTSEITEIKPPVLDLDAMLEDLHNEFQDEPEGSDGDTTTDDGTGVRDDRQVSDSGAGEGESGDDGAVGEAVSSSESGVGDLLPPGYVRLGEEILPEQEVKALLELNRRVKSDPDTATRVRNAVLGQQQTQAQAETEDALPAWIDPDDPKDIFFFRQQQRVDRELEEIKRNDQLRTQQQALTQEEARRVEVLDAFRTSMKEFQTEHPTFGPEDLKVITDRAASMGLLEAPEKVGGTLRAGIVTALDTAMWSMPEYREKVAAGATVPSKEQRSATRKQKSSALSSSTGSVVRTQSQEPTPTTRKEVMAGALDFLRSGTVTD